MELILWRHAEAEDSSPDMARMLTKKGRNQAARLAEYLAERGQFDSALKYARGEYSDRPDLYSAATLARV